MGTRRERRVKKGGRKVLRRGREREELQWMDLRNSHVPCGTVSARG